MKRVLIIATKYAKYVINRETWPKNLKRNKNIVPQFRYYLKLDFKIRHQKNDNLAILMLNPSESDMDYWDPTVKKLAEELHHCYKSIQVFNVNPTFETGPSNLKPLAQQYINNNLSCFQTKYNKKDDILVATGDLLRFNDDVNKTLIDSYTKLLNNINSSKIKILGHSNTIFGIHPASRGKKHVNINCSNLISTTKKNISLF